MGLIAPRRLQAHARQNADRQRFVTDHVRDRQRLGVAGSGLDMTTRVEGEPPGGVAQFHGGGLQRPSHGRAAVQAFAQSVLRTVEVPLRDIGDRGTAALIV
jgi:hypothetical protein